MKRIAWMLAAVTVAALTGALLWADSGNSGSSPTPLWLDEFDHFNVRFKKSYPSMADRALRFRIFQENAQLVAAHNANPTATYTLELNQFADLTFEEFSAYYLSNAPEADLTKDHCKVKMSPLPRRPDTVDWVKAGMVQKIKNQKACGSCWAFSAVGAVESAVAIANKMEVPDLSEQELVDCSHSYGNFGCLGGFPWTALDYILDHNINTSKDYPYLAKNDVCQTEKIGQGKTEITGCVVVPGTIDDLADAIAVTPVAIGFAVQNDFMLYKEGIYNPESCLTQCNHGMVAVGYNSKGDRSGLPYFLVKNSWGEEWGEQGYVKVAFGTEGGTCNIAGNGRNVYPTI